MIFKLLASGFLTAANIIFPFVQPSCDFSTHKGCLRGQVCLPDGTCIPGQAASHDAVARAVLQAASSARADGRCGREFDGATCEPDGAYGSCCSQYGYCGKTPQHCLTINGCQSGCTSDLTESEASSATSAPKAATTVPASPPPPTKVSNAALSNSEPVIGPATSTSPAAAESGPVTTNGMCGASNNNMVSRDVVLSVQQG